MQVDYSAKISIVVPVYNVEKYLPECLSSLLNQTLLDIEIICVNDGSIDNSLEILNTFANTDNRIVVLSQENKGLPAARNAGLQIARGDIVMFCDSDDLLAPNACERIWREFLEAPTDICVFGTAMFPQLSDPTPWYYSVLNISTKRFDHFTPDVLFGGHGALPFVWRQAYKREFLQEYNLSFAEDVKFGEDSVFQLEAFPHGRNFSFIADKLYKYRWIRPGSLMADVNKNKDEKIAKHMIMLKHVFACYKKNNWFEDFGPELMEWCLRFVVPDCLGKSVRRGKDYLREFADLIVAYDAQKYLPKVNKSAQYLVDKLPLEKRF